jgi:peptide/nickel transport system permease protein
MIESDSQVHVDGTMEKLSRYWAWLNNLRRRSLEAWSIFAQNRLAVLGVVLILIYTVMAIAHPILLATVWPKVTYDPQVGFDMAIYPHPSPPSVTHLLGTDTLGRDVLSMLLAATTPTYIMALTAAITTAIVSTVIGAASSFLGGTVDAILTHLTNLALLIPAPLVMVVIGGTIDISPVQFGLMYGLIAGAGGAAIIMRSQALSIVNKQFIEAARVAGGGKLHIILHHLTPNMLPLAAVQMLLTVTGAVFAFGFSAFLGLSRTRLNWGSMIYSGFVYQNLSATITWNLLIPAALAISFFSAAFYFIARGVHEVAEPRLRGR